MAASEPPPSVLQTCTVHAWGSVCKTGSPGDLSLGVENVSRNTDLGKRFQPESGARGVKGDSHIGDVVVLRDKKWRW